MDDLISRQAAIDAIHEDADWLASQGSDWQTERMERDRSILRSLPSAQPEITEDDVKEYCRKRCLIVVTSDFYDEMMSRWSSAQPEIEERKEESAQNVSKEDLISRKAAIDAIGSYILSFTAIDRNYYEGLRDAKRLLHSMPSAQPDIIVCADCKHWICHDRRCGYWNHGVKPLDWCCHAERRTDE